MLKTLLQAKLHRVVVTGADLNYEGSCGIDEDLLDASGMVEGQYVEIYNVTNGERFSTYLIKNLGRSGAVTVNGAAARKAMLGDVLIICSYSQYTESDLADYAPKVVLVDSENRPRNA